MFIIGNKVTRKKNLGLTAETTLNQANIVQDKIYKIIGIDLQYNTYYGGANQLLKFRHTIMSVPAEYFDLVKVSVGFVID